jgi:predicted MPP superfamily phosphohydrolase
MKLLLVHLSDLHIKSSTDHLLGRSQALGAAARAFGSEADARLLIVTGDIAFAGEEEQYDLAAQFLKEVSSAMIEAGPNGTHPPLPNLVVVPGNHDCDFSQATRIRELALNAAKTDSQLDESVLYACTSPQDAFFAFATEQSRPHPLEAPESTRRLTYTHVIQHGATRLRILCCNSAWMSQLREEQGSLSYFTSVLPAREKDDALVIAALHHPYNWFQATAARELRTALEERVDVILTGHEHEPGSVGYRRSTGANNTYIEGGVLQESGDESVSSFNIIEIDTAVSQQRVTTLNWNGEAYSPLEAENCEADAWEDFRTNRLRTRGRFDFSPKTLNFLHDPGLTITHASRDVTLQDIFVCPDLRESTVRTEPSATQQPIIRGERVVDFLCSLQEPFLLTGDDEAGKTSLAKQLMLQYLDRGQVPIFLDLATEKLRLDRIQEQCVDTFIAQYENIDRDAYRQLPRSRRVVVVDNYHRVDFSTKNKKKLLSALQAFAGGLVLVAHDLLVGLEGLTGSDPSTAFRSFRIQPFGHLRRQALIQQWLLLSDVAEADAHGFFRALEGIRRTIDSILGRNFVPAYPPYLLAVLQAAQAATPVDTHASTHGYFYELFIKTALAKNRTSIQYDILVSYLAHIAFRLFLARRSAIGVTQLEEWHDEYLDRHDISLDFNKGLRQLVDQRILILRNDEIAFAYPYVYYYFVAAYFRDHIGEPSVRQHVTALAKSIDAEESANVLLFLAHLSRDPAIINDMLNAARSLFEHSPAATMVDDVAFLDELTRAREEPPVFQDSMRPLAVRAQISEQLDEEAHLQTDHDPSRNTSEAIVRAGMAIRTLQILGQIVKNFPGSLERDTKALIVRECYDLARRGLGWVYQAVRDNQKTMLDEVSQVIRQANPRIPDEKLADRAQDAIANLAFVASLGFIKRVSLAVGAPDLGATYKRVLDPRILLERLFDISIWLDQGDSFPSSLLTDLAKEVRSNPMALAVLRSLVTQHLRLFPVDLSTKQRTCAELGMKYEQVTPMHPKLLAK